MNIVDNAIILAAGEAQRCRPLSALLPKGLFIIKDEVLIERQIRQILEAGVPQVIVVVGYMAEKFSYLHKKYNVDIIYNPEFASTNNISSLWYAKEYLGNSYICGSDNWFSKNLFKNQVEDSYFSSLYSDSEIDEYCISLKNGYICEIKKGGAHSWYTLGEIFFSQKLSRQFKQDLEREYLLPGIKNLIIDEYCIKHLRQYRFQTIHREKGEILEFDSIDEILTFDPDFKKRYQITGGKNGKYETRLVHSI